MIALRRRGMEQVCNLAVGCVRERLHVVLRPISMTGDGDRDAFRF